MTIDSFVNTPTYIHETHKSLNSNLNHFVIALSKSKMLTMNCSVFVSQLESNNVCAIENSSVALCDIILTTNPYSSSQLTLAGTRCMIMIIMSYSSYVCESKGFRTVTGRPISCLFLSAFGTCPER